MILAQYVYNAHSIDDEVFLSYFHFIPVVIHSSNPERRNNPRMKEENHFHNISDLLARDTYLYVIKKISKNNNVHINCIICMPQCSILGSEQP